MKTTSMEKGIIGILISMVIVFICCILFLVKCTTMFVKEVDQNGLKGVADKVWNGSNRK